MEEKYYDLIEKHKDGFTSQQMRISNFISHDFELIAFKSLKSFALLAGVSTTSVIRFSRSLGLGGYKELQELIRDNFFKKESMPRRLKDIEFDSNSDLLNEIFSQEIENIKTTMLLQDLGNIEKVIKSLEDSENIYVLGMRSSFSLAYYFFSRFAQVKENVHLIQTSGMMFPEEISGISKKDCLIAFVYPRYSRVTVNILSMIKEVGTKNIVFTSEMTPQLQKISDMVLSSSVEGVMFKNSYTAAVCLIDYLIAYYVRENKDESLKQLDKIETRLTKGSYLS